MSLHLYRYNNEVNSDQDVVYLQEKVTKGDILVSNLQLRRFELKHIRGWQTVNL